MPIPHAGCGVPDGHRRGARPEREAEGESDVRLSPTCRICERSERGAGRAGVVKLFMISLWAKRSFDAEGGSEGHGVCAAYREPRVFGKNVCAHRFMGRDTGVCVLFFCRRSRAVLRAERALSSSAAGFQRDAVIPAGERPGGPAVGTGRSNIRGAAGVRSGIVPPLELKPC